MMCGVEFMSGRRMLQLASMFWWVYGLFVYADMFFGRAVVGYELYLIAVIPAVVIVGFMACLMAHPDAGEDTTPSIDVDDDILERVIFSYIPLLLVLLFPFPFLLHAHETHPSSYALIFAIIYVGAAGLLLLILLEAYKNMYWLLLCVLIAFVCTPLTGFRPHHPRLLKLKLITALLSVVIAFLCGLVYYSHCRSEARFLLQNRAGLPLPAAQPAQPTNPAAATATKGDDDQTKPIDNIVLIVILNESEEIPSIQSM